MGEGTVKKSLTVGNVGEDSPSLRDALEYELNLIESSIDAFENEVEALKALIDWHVSVAVDIRVNGGWQLVPSEPTEEMLKVGGHVNSEWLNDNAPIGESRYAMPMKSVYQTMLTAAPKHTGESK